MLNALVPYVMALRERWPRVFAFLVSIGKRYLGGRLGVFPRPLAREIDAVTAVLQGSQWNMAYGKGLAHERLEEAFARYIGVDHAIAVNTGGMALQMSLRALGLKPGDEVLHQIDTCSATALAVMNAGCTPILADISAQTFMLSASDMETWTGSGTRALIATHMWGNVEDLDTLIEFKKKHRLWLIEDSCLALGAHHAGSTVGSFGDVGVFSFGCLKPIQGGEGGMIVTRDESLARELRAMRHWGDKTLDFGVRDVEQLAWNGRMSEIVAAVVAEQLEGYPAHLRQLREAVGQLEQSLAKIDGLEIVYGTARGREHASFTQVVLRLDEPRFGWKKAALMENLRKRGVHVWHANFELINSLTFFKQARWKDWILRGDTQRLEANIARDYPVAQRVFDSTGLGLGRMNFLSTGNLQHLIRQIEQLAAHKKA